MTFVTRINWVCTFIRTLYAAPTVPVDLQKRLSGDGGHYNTIMPFAGKYRLLE